MAVHVNVDNFRAAETARVFDGILKLSGGINQWFHYREPTGVDNQPVIRMNRDALQLGTGRHQPRSNRDVARRWRSLYDIDGGER